MATKLSKLMLVAAGTLCGCGLKCVENFYNWLYLGTKWL